MRNKRLVLLFTFLMALFVMVNYAIWNLWTENLITFTHYDGGDLARMGYILDSKMYRHNSLDLPHRHISMKNYTGQKIDVVTLGDSFSFGGGGGRNGYYQDYIASINNCTVLNLEPYRSVDNISVLSMYANNGYLEKIKPKYVILEVSEKMCIEKLAHAVDFNAMISFDDLAKQKKINYNDKLPEVGFINEGNLKFLLYRFLYYLSDHAFLSKVYTKDLSYPFFSVKSANKLVFFRDDIKHIPLASTQSVELLNDNLNTLADKLQANGIKLYFMPCVDKYNLYRDYLKHNSYPESTLFERLRKLRKRYEFIDTKAILAGELKRGEKDVFYADDTHWSWKASQKIFETVRFH